MNPEPQTRHIPPQAPELEEAVLGAMLLEQEAVETATAILQPDDFYRPAHRHMYEAMLYFIDRNETLDPLKIEQRLRDQKLFEETGGEAVINDLFRSVSSAEHTKWNCRVILEKSLRRQYIAASQKILADAYDSSTDTWDVLNQASALVDKLTDTREINEGQLVREYVEPFLAKVEAARANPHKITGVPAGLDIDNFTAGWQPGDLVIIAARPSMGKTALMVTIADNAATHPEERLRAPGMIISLEMSAQQIIRRFVGKKAAISQTHIRSGKIDDKEYETICTDIARQLYELNIIIDDTPLVNLRTLGQKIRKKIKQHGIKWVMIDYLQLIESGRRSENRNIEIGQITRGLKLIAKQYQIPVILLSQLSRQVELRGGDKRPQLSDLRDSGNIEQDADVIAFIYRAEYYNITTTPEGQSTAGLAEIIIAKQRDGPVGKAIVNFQKEIGRFVNLSHHNTDLSAPTGSDSVGGTVGSVSVGTNKRPKHYRSPLPDDDYDDDPGF